VFDYGHICRFMVEAQAGQVVVEDDIEDPAETVFDPPMGAHDTGEVPEV
jgi:hypothetical protein